MRFYSRAVSRPGEPVDWKKVLASPRMKKVLRAWEEPVRQRWRFRSEGVGLFGFSMDEILEAVEAVSQLPRDEEPVRQRWRLLRVG